MTDIPADWYDDPEDAAQYRYWDGSQWTDHRAPKSVSSGGGEAAISTGWSLFRHNWVPLLGVAAVMFVVALIGVAILLVTLATALDPGPLDIIDRVTDPGFDPNNNLADEAFVDSITFDASPGVIVLAVVGGLVTIAAQLLAQGASMMLLADRHRGGSADVGTVLGAALRRFPRWVGIWLLWGLVGTLVLGVFVAAAVVAPVLLILLVPAALVGIIYGYPYLFLVGTTLAVGPRSNPPFRTTIGLVRGSWRSTAWTVLLINLVLIAVTVAGAIVGVIPVLGIVLNLVVSFVANGLFYATTVVLYGRLGGVVDPVGS